MTSPRIIVLFGNDPAVQRAVGSELSDLLPRSSVLSFATPLREAYRTTFDLPRSTMLLALEVEKVTEWEPKFRDFLRGWGGETVLGVLAVQHIQKEYWSSPVFIIDDGSDEYIKDIKVITKNFKSEVLIVNFGDTLPLRSNSHAVTSIGDQKSPEEIATYISLNLEDQPSC